MKTLNKIKWLCMATLVLSLFLTWFKNVYFSIPGYEIIKFPYLIENIVFNKHLERNMHLITYLFYIVYAIPIAVLLILIFYKKKNIGKYFLIIGSVPIIIIFTTIYNRSHLIKFLGIGAYIALVSSILIIISIIYSVKSKQINIYFNDYRVILLCICFFIIFIFFTAPHPFPRVKTDIETIKTKETLSKITIAIDGYEKTHFNSHKYKSFEELVNLRIGGKTFSERYLKDIPLKDAWGRSFIYKTAGNNKKYILSSNGKNGKPGDNDDIYYYNF